MSFDISVIIPVYNAEKFLRKAVESAVSLPEVAEVILIEDGSPDNALAVCNELRNEFSKVKIFRHPNGENRGAGASRNLGIKHAYFDYIAFLDADDWYLPNRFTETARLFLEQPDVDGVYAPVGTHFYSEFEIFMGKPTSRETGQTYVTFFTRPVKASEVFYEMLTMSHGTFCTDGITLKKSLIGKAGGFNEALRLHQDSEMWIRCAYYGKLVGTDSSKIVAMRGVHAANRVKHTNFQSRSLLYATLYNYFSTRPVEKRERKVLDSKYINYFPKRKFYSQSRLLQLIEKAVIWLYIKIFERPKVNHAKK